MCVMCIQNHLLWSKTNSCLLSHTLFKTDKIAVLSVRVNGFQVKDFVDHGLWHGDAIYAAVLSRYAGLASSMIYWSSLIFTRVGRVGRMLILRPAKYHHAQCSARSSVDTYLASEIFFWTDFLSFLKDCLPQTRQCLDPMLEGPIWQLSGFPLLNPSWHFELKIEIVTRATDPE